MYEALLTRLLNSEKGGVICASFCSKIPHFSVTTHEKHGGDKFTFLIGHQDGFGTAFVQEGDGIQQTLTQLSEFTLSLC